VEYPVTSERYTMKKSIMVSVLIGITSGLTLMSCSSSGTLVTGEEQPADQLMGDWQGHRVTHGGEVVPLAVQMVAYGDGNYEARMQEEFDRRDPSSRSLAVRREGDRLVFQADRSWTGTIVSDVVSGQTSRGEAESFELHKIKRVSPALGARPPSGAIVLFDGTSFAGWDGVKGGQQDKSVGWKLVGGAMQVVGGTGSIVTKQKFTDFRLHLEFRTPFMPAARGQARGNSGVYLQGRYEIQVLDSYGLEGADNDCGGIYKVAAPRVNMCAPPGQWQSYDVTWRAPRFDENGEKTSNARVTALHNGVIIHDNLEISGPTEGPLDKNVQAPGGIYLQDHGNPVEYRNIWIVDNAQRGNR
jgi:hypothetical protein